MQQQVRLKTTPSGQELGVAPNEQQKLFQINGVVRSFTPVDRAALDAKLVAAEKQFGIRLGIQETQPDPSFSAFASDRTAVASESARDRLVRRLTDISPPSR